MMVPLLLLFVSVYLSNGQDYDADCVTPTGLASNCISIENCDKLKSLIRLPPKQREALRAWTCGFDGDVPMVCCPPTAPKTQCRTADGKIGVCVSETACPSIRRRLEPPVTKEDIDFAMLSKCKGPAAVNFCCEDPMRNPTDTIPNDKTTEPSVVPLSLPTSASTTTERSEPSDRDAKEINCKDVTDVPDLKSGCCGVESSGGNRIVGGNATAIDQYPWLALIEYPDLRWVCGGSLISRLWVLTAAHCLVTHDLKSRNAQSVRLGDYNITNPGSDCIDVEGGGVDCIDEPISIKIDKTILHPEYKKVPKIVESNDIALIRLKDLAPYTDFIRPICLPVSDILQSPPLDMRLYVAGWGAISETQSTSDVKFHVDLPLYEKSNCETLYSMNKKSIIWEKQLCAGGEKNKDSCQGDSGGPLMFAEDGKPFEILGITSFGVKQCGFFGRPSIYTKVASYLDWIRSETRPGA